MAPLTVNLFKWIGSVPEWLMGADCKSAGYAYVGSNPTRPIFSTSPCSSAVEHSLGKGEVSGSSPDEGIVGGTSKRFNRNQETSRGLFFNAKSLQSEGSSERRPSGNIRIHQKLKIKVPLKFPTNIQKVPHKSSPRRAKSSPRNKHLT